MNAVTVPRNQANAPTPLPSTLGDHVGRSVRRYLSDLGDASCEGDLYALVMNEAERPLLHEVMRHCDSNQSRAAQVLGISRATLRKKLLAHGLV